VIRRSARDDRAGDRMVPCRRATMGEVGRTLLVDCPSNSAHPLPGWSSWACVHAVHPCPDWAQREGGVMAGDAEIRKALEAAVGRELPAGIGDDVVVVREYIAV
jgi:hypothetical protein